MTILIKYLTECVIADFQRILHFKLVLFLISALNICG